MVDIIGYEGLYKISEDGVVFSVRTNLELKQSVSTTGYLRVNFNNKDGGKTHKVHRLVAIHFLPNPNGYKCVNHIDGNKLNNHVSNLEWCTYVYNNRHARTTGLNVNPKGIDSQLCKRVRRKDTGEVFYSLIEASKACGKFKNRSSLSSHLAGRSYKSFDGTTWEFIKDEV